MRKLIWSVVLLASVVLTSEAWAERPLTDREVRGFAASLAEVETFLARLEEAGMLPDADTEDALANPVSLAVQSMRSQDALKAFEAAIRRHGFADAGHWGAVGDRVYRAYFALVMEREAAAARVEMRQALEDSQTNPHLSPEEKQAMREMMNGALAGMRVAMQTSDADKSAVAPHVGLIERAWKLAEQD